MDAFADDVPLRHGHFLYGQFYAQVSAGGEHGLTRRSGSGRQSCLTYKAAELLGLAPKGYTYHESYLLDANEGVGDAREAISKSAEADQGRSRRLPGPYGLVARLAK